MAAKLQRFYHLAKFFHQNPCIRQKLSIPLRCSTHNGKPNAGGACIKMQAFFMLVLNDIEVLLYPRGKL